MGTTKSIAAARAQGWMCVEPTRDSEASSVLLNDVNTSVVRAWTWVNALKKERKEKYACRTYE
jgi:hypothetical protein